MNKKLIIRVLAIIALVGAIGSAVTVSLFFFNMLGEMSGLFGTLAVVFICFTVAFYIPTYILNKQLREKPEYLPDEESGGKSDGVTGSDDKADESESDVDSGDDVVPDPEVKDGGKDEQDK